MNKAQIVIAAIQTVLFIVALTLLALNRHESFQDFMIMSLFIGQATDGFTKKHKNDDEENSETSQVKGE